MSNITYPPLKLLLSENDLPDAVAKFTESISSVFDKVYYKEYYFEKSPMGDAASYKLTLLMYDRVALDIPGTGMSLVLNPSYTGGEPTTDVKVSMDYKLEAVKYAMELSPDSFAASPISYFETLLSLGNLSIRQVVEEVIALFVGSADPLQQFVTDFNDKYSSAQITLNSGIDADVLIDLCCQIEEHGVDTFTYLFEEYIQKAADFETQLGKIKQLFSKWFDDFDLGDILKRILIPQISASIDDINLALEFPRSVFRPMFYDPKNKLHANTNKFIGEEVDWKGRLYADSSSGADDKPDAEQLKSYKSKLSFNVGSVRFSTENGLEFVGENDFGFTKSMIGNTGLTLYFENMKLDLSRNKNIPEATAAGYSNDFTGVFVEQAEIGLPEKWFKNATTGGATLGVFGENLLLGTGGVSGKFGIKATNTEGIPTGEEKDPEAEMEFKLGGDSGFLIGFKHFDMTMRQGALVETNIAGSLTIPVNKKGTTTPLKVGIEVGIQDDGDFTITASKSDAIYEIEIPNVFSFKMESLSVGKEDGKFFISTAGKIDFDEQSSVGKVFSEPLHLDKLIIWEDGSFEIKGLDGALSLKEPRVMQLGPAKVTVTAIHFGSHEQIHGGEMRKYWYFGFDGGVSINPGGIDAKGDGIKLYFTVDKKQLHVFFRIQSINVDLIIPGKASKESAAALISGYLSMKDPAATTPAGQTPTQVGSEFIGGISLSLPKIKLSASAAMRLNPSVPAFLIDTSLSLPMSIPLGATGLGIYGFRGLLGQKYVATKKAAGVSDDDPWYEYYKAKVAPDFKQGVQPSKFENKKGFSVGAGVSLATNFDSGKVFSAKLFFMLSLPEVFLMEGQAGILRQRIDLDTSTDPPFYAMLAISPSSVEAALGANLNIPEDSGDIASLSGLLEMGFFFGNAGAWYLNVGRDLPEEKRVRARLFTLFNAYFYYMMSKQGIKAGAGVSWEFKKKLGPVRVSAGAYLNVAGKISFKPVQIGGSIDLGGFAEISVFGLGFGIGIYAGLAAEAPRPFIITGYITVKLKLPWPFKKIKFTLDFTWSFNRQIDLSEVPLLDGSKVKAVNMLTKDSYQILYQEGGTLPVSIPNEYIIPVDSYIDIEFNKGMGWDGTFSNAGKYETSEQSYDFSELIPPQKGKSDQVRHTYLVKNIEIKSLGSNGWQTYDVYEALTPIVGTYAKPEIKLVNTDINNLKYGHWQVSDPGKNTKLKILARSPLLYVAQADELIPEDLGYDPSFLTCTGQLPKWKSLDFNVSRPVFEAGKRLLHDSVLFRVIGVEGVVSEFTTTLGLSKALSASGSIEIFFPKAYAQVNLILQTFADGVKVSSYKQVLKAERGYNHLPQYEYVLIEEQELTATELNTIVKLNADGGSINQVENPIAKITIETIGSGVLDGLLLQEMAEQMLQENVGGLLVDQSNQYQLQTQLYGMRMYTVEDFLKKLTIPGEADKLAQGDAMKTGFEKTIQPIWRPNTSYWINIITQDALDRGGRSYSRAHNFYFKTAGPVGHFHKYDVDSTGKAVYRYDYQALMDKNSEDQYKLATLQHYINMDKSYPNADGRLTNAKPMFYKRPQVSLFYKQDYMYSMFNNYAEYNGNGLVESSVELLIKDPTEKPTDKDGNTTQALSVPSEWVKEVDPMIPRELELINNLLEHNISCTSLPRAEKFSLKQDFIIPDDSLKPDKLYTAVFNGKYRRSTDVKADSSLIHSYVFKTSIYADFKEQIQSFYLTVGGGTEEPLKALFEIKGTFSVDALTEAEAVFNGISNNNELKTMFADEYDRLVTGVLKLDNFAQAVSTDVNIIKSSGRILGIIVRNQEPFNDPKTPKDVLANSIVLTYADGTPFNGKVIFSKDRTKAFISNSDLNIASGEMELAFKYLLFDGKSYKDSATPETISFIA